MQIKSKEEALNEEKHVHDDIVYEIQSQSKILK
jgi:hypothetical protein